MKKHLSTIILVLILVTGLSLMLYPTISEYWNIYHQSRIISEYTEDVEAIDTEEYARMWWKAEEYNHELARNGNCWEMTEEEKQRYYSLLNVGGTGVMGYIKIPKIKCSLPIYHGADKSILQVAIGHIGGSSLPVGGNGTHCVLSGHSGLPSAKLFTNLDQMKKGDIFLLKVLNETLAYEVDQIKIVLPEEIEDLEIEEGKDLCTLVTCSPYGVNSHRLLVRGHRVAYTEEQEQLVETPKTFWEKIVDFAEGIKRRTTEWLIWFVEGVKEKWLRK